ncbi:hypothetical protein IPH25_02710 [bacterium]|nr:MAG: hypothetical protein IPG37_04850 [bacterium]QQR61379.1 MAG: hypothetical protein IPH25_02710 [bacterium]QQR63101.1 MAG: hypothetical protein IPH67_01330 [bacterium]
MRLYIGTIQFYFFLLLMQYCLLHAAVKSDYRHTFEWIPVSIEQLSVRSFFAYEKWIMCAQMISTAYSIHCFKKHNDKEYNDQQTCFSHERRRNSLGCFTGFILLYRYYVSICLSNQSEQKKITSFTSYCCANILAAALGFIVPIQ